LERLGLRSPGARYHVRTLRYDLSRKPRKKRSVSACVPLINFQRLPARPPQSLEIVFQNVYDTLSHVLRTARKPPEAGTPSDLRNRWEAIQRKGNAKEASEKVSPPHSILAGIW